jgi:hypothetical protein
MAEINRTAVSRKEKVRISLGNAQFILQKLINCDVQPGNLGIRQK